MAKKGAKTLCFKIRYKTPLNGRKNNPTFVDKFGFLTQNEIYLTDVLILGQVSPPDIKFCFIFFLTQLFISKRDIP